MDDAGGVRGAERVGDLRADVERAHHVEHRLATEHLREGPPLEILHHEEVIAVGGLAEVVDLDDVRVADLVDRARLLEEALHDLAVAGELAVMTLSATRLPSSGCSARYTAPMPPVPIFFRTR